MFTLIDNFLYDFFFFQTTPSSLKPSPIFWYAVINGKRETIAFIANGKVTVFKQCLNKCKIMEPATLTIGNLTDNDFTTYDIEITTPGIAKQLTSNTTVVKAGSKILHLVLFFNNFIETSLHLQQTKQIRKKILYTTTKKRIY